MTRPVIYGFKTESTERLLLQALLKSLSDAVSSNDGSAGDRYQRRIRLIARHFDTNPLISDALERLFSASGRWLATSTAKRHEVEQQVQDGIERVIELL